LIVVRVVAWWFLLRLVPVPASVGDGRGEGA